MTGVRDGRAPRRILLVQIRRLGDTLLTTALLPDLRRAFPDATLDFLTRPALAALLQEHPLVSECVRYDRTRPFGMWSAVRARSYDWIVDSESSPRSALLSLASGAPVRVGWAVRAWGRLYTHRVSRRSGRPPEYVVSDRQRLLEAMGVPVAPARPRLYLTAEELAIGRDALRALGAPAGVPWVGLLLSAGSVSKEWPVERFAELADSLAALGVAPVLFHMPGDEPKLARFTAATRAATVAPGADVRQFVRMLAACAAFVSGDTGPAHAATALDVPTVTVFGPSDPRGWSPQLPITAVVRGDTRRCPQCARGARDVAHACMASVEAGTVLARAREYLDHARGAAAAAPPVPLIGGA